MADLFFSKKGFADKTIEVEGRLMSVFKWLKVSRYMKYCMAIGLLGSMTLQAMAQYTGKVFVDENRKWSPR